MKYPSRTKRRNPQGARVTPRDLIILLFIACGQPVTTAQICRLIGASKAMVRRRLRVLRDLGLVNVSVLSLDSSSIFTLADKARPLLARVFGSSPDDYQVVRSVSANSRLEHHFAVVDFYLNLRLATLRTRRLDLVEVVFEREIRSVLGLPSRDMLVPDAIAVLESERGNRLGLNLELDLATENPRYFVETKVAAYSELAEAGRAIWGTKPWIVVCQVPSLRRRNRLLRHAWTTGLPEGLWYFAVQDEVTDRNVLDNVWVTPRMQEDGLGAHLVAESPLHQLLANRDHDGDRERDVERERHGVRGCDFKHHGVREVKPSNFKELAARSKGPLAEDDLR